MHQLPSQPQKLTRVFVYGTLKPGESNYQTYCAAKVIEAKTAIALGQLFALPFGYPAMVQPGNSPVTGCLLTFPDSTILQHLDWLEDYDAQREAAANEYNRQLIKTYAPDFTPFGEAWVYLMTPEQVKAAGGSLLPHGCWSSNLVAAAQRQLESKSTSLD